MVAKADGDLECSRRIMGEFGEAMPCSKAFGELFATERSPQ
ncbi:MAG: hypothetical protein JWQ50_6141 [Caballeronia mineralivorans]|nr:hypothetical protein [Caballeronia mineralivorans]